MFATGKPDVTIRVERKRVVFSKGQEVGPSQGGQGDGLVGDIDQAQDLVCRSLASPDGEHAVVEPLDALGGVRGERWVLAPSCEQSTQSAMNRSAPRVGLEFPDEFGFI